MTPSECKCSSTSFSASSPSKVPKTGIAFHIKSKPCPIRGFTISALATYAQIAIRPVRVSDFTHQDMMLGEGHGLRFELARVTGFAAPKRHRDGYDNDCGSLAHT